MELNSIGFFQLDNLLQSRIPMTLLLLDEVDIKSWYNSLVRMHLENITILCDKEDALSKIQDKQLPAQFAIIVLDNDGKKSPKVAAALEKAGYINAYFVEGGFTALLLDKK